MDIGEIIGAGQIRAARALLEWSQDDLAEAAGLSVATIRKLELGHISPRHATTGVLRRAIENAGLEFIEPDGVRRCREDIVVYQGKNGIAAFLDDIRQTARKCGGDIAIVVTPEVPLSLLNEDCRELKNIIAADSRAAIKCLTLDGANALPASPQTECRSISRCYVEPLPSYVYGDRHAIIIPGDKTGPKIIAIRSLAGAQAARRQFYSIWDKAMPLNLYTKSVQIDRIGAKMMGV